MIKEVLGQMYEACHNSYGESNDFQVARIFFGTDDNNEAEEILNAAVTAETEAAFKSGFYAAVSLLMGGVK